MIFDIASPKMAVKAGLAVDAGSFIDQIAFTPSDPIDAEACALRS